MRLGTALDQRLVAQGLQGQLLQLEQLTIQAVGLRQWQQRAGQAQPDQQALDARQLFAEVFRLLLVTLQLECLGFLAEQVQQPVAQRGLTLAIATVVAFDGPATDQQPARALQGEQAPAVALQFGGEQRRRIATQVVVGAAVLQARAPVCQQRIQGRAQLVGAGARGGLAEAGEQGTQVGQLLQPLLQQFPVAIPALLFGQALAAAQQVPAECGNGIVQ